MVKRLAVVIELGSNLFPALLAAVPGVLLAVFYAVFDKGDIHGS